MFNTIRLDQYSKFKCDVSCIDHCCRISSWAITIDKNTLETYHTIPGELGDQIRKSIIYRKDKAYFDSATDGKCVLLGDDRLCLIHKHLGEDKLCATCKTYPRSHYYYNRLFHSSLDISCPVVAQMLLFKTDPLLFHVAEAPVQVPDKSTLVTGAIDEAACFKIRGICAEILQKRSAPLFHRLTYLAMLFSTINEIDHSSDYQPQLRQIMNEYTSHIDHITEMTSDVVASLEQMVLDKTNLYYVIQNLLMILCRGERRSDINPELFNRLDVMTAQSDQGKMIHYSYIRRKSFLPYYHTHEHVFENYLVLLMFAKPFPVHENGPYAAFIDYLLQYIMFQYFISTLYTDKALTDDDIIIAAYYYTRRTSHSKLYKESIKKLNAGYNDLVQPDTLLALLLPGKI